MTTSLGEDIHMVIEGLFVGNNAAIDNSQRLKMLVSSLNFGLNSISIQNITHVLVLSYPQPEKEQLDNEIKYMCIELHDDYKSNIFYHLPQGIEFIQEALTVHSVASKANIHQSPKGGVLVASNNGICRSPSIVAAYLMYAKRMTLPNALAFVKLKRKQSNPNSHYLRQLEQLE